MLKCDSLNTPNDLKRHVRHVYVSVLQMRKLRHKDVKGLAKTHNEEVREHEDKADSRTQPI